jgi:hypothetical protein
MGEVCGMHEREKTKTNVKLFGKKLKERGNW